MPKEQDPQVLRLLEQLLNDRSSNVPEIADGALSALRQACPENLRRNEMIHVLKSALVRCLQRLGPPNRVDYPGQAEFGWDPVVIHEFRNVWLWGEHYYVQFELTSSDETDPEGLIRDLKPDDEIPRA
jgi:hypothetical protein